MNDDSLTHSELGNCCTEYTEHNLNSEAYFSVLEAITPGSRRHQSWFLVRSRSLAYRGPHTHCVIFTHTDLVAPVSSLCVKKRDTERERSNASSYRGTSSIGRARAPLLHLIEPSSPP